MTTTTFVIGGCRSGKSSHALAMANRIGGRRKIFLATCVPRGDEMQQRVRRHQHERSREWQTVEAPLEVPEAIDTHGPNASVILVDCLTLWTSNLLLENEDLDVIESHAQRLAASLATAACPVILVSNEVGTGIVPENRLARLFRDATGFVNQRVATACQQVIWMVAGIPVTVKPK